MRPGVLSILILVLCGTTCVADETLPVKKAVKAFLDAYEAGDPAAFKNHWSAERTTVNGRTEKPDQYDVALKWGTLDAYWELAAQKLESKAKYSDVTVKVDVLSAELQLRSQFPRGNDNFESFAEIYRLRKLDGVWKIDASRTWPVESTINGVTTKYTEESLAEMDKEAEQALRARQDVIEERGEVLRQATRRAAFMLVKAYRTHEAYALAKELSADQMAGHWKLRAQLALIAGDPKDSLFSYRKLLTIDPDADIPEAARQRFEQEKKQAKELERGLMRVLGDDFEYLSGEFGRANMMPGYTSLKRFWFARVRAKTAGSYAISYRTKVLEAFDPAQLDPQDHAIYLLSFKVHERGARRFVRDWPEIGDTLILPVHADLFVSDHAFFKADASLPMRTPDDPSRARLEGPVDIALDPSLRDVLKLVSSGGGWLVDRAGTSTEYHVGAAFELLRPGEWQFAGRLSDNSQEEQLDVISLRVVKKDQPITVMISTFHRKEHTRSSRSASHYHLAAGTLEARVGDKVCVGCGSYRVAGMELPDKFRPGIVESQPFVNVPAYLSD